MGIPDERRHRLGRPVDRDRPRVCGGREGYFFALDAKTGSLLWKSTVGGQVASGPMTYAVNGKQYVAVSAGNNLFVYALRQ